MRNRETAYTFFDRTDGRNSRKIFNEKEIRTSQTETCKKSFAELPPSEKAAIMKMLYNMNYDPEQQDALQNEEEFGYYTGRCRSRKELAERFGYSSRNVDRYLRINELIQPIKDLVDTSRISLVAAVELSHLAVEEQWIVYRGILSRGLKLKHRAAEELRKHSGELTEEMVIDQFGLANTSRNLLVSFDSPRPAGCPL